MILFAIVCISAFLRLFHLGQLPIGFTHDETALGYTAYSLLKTGSDIKGNFLPLAISPFGNWTLPLYSYITTIPISMFGLNEFATRLPSAISGILGTFLMYVIAQIIFKKKFISLTASLFFALSPWSIFFSRSAYEVNVATTLFLGGLYLFLTYVEGKNKNGLILFTSFILFALTLFTYFSYILFTPLFLACLLFAYRKSLKNTKFTYLCYFVFLLFFSVSLLVTATQSMKQLSSVGIFNDKNVIYNRVDILRGDNTEKEIIINKLLHNKFLGVSYQIAQNYLSSFSPSFLFDRGGESALSNTGFFGNMYIVDSLFLIVGFAGLFYARDKRLWLIAPWLILGPLSGSFTDGAPNSTRLFVLLPALILISSYGAYQIYVFCKKNKILNIIILPVLVLLFLFNVVYFLDYYFIHFNYHNSRQLHYGFKQAVELSNKYPSYQVVMKGPEQFPFISFLFYNSYDPIKFRKEVKYFSVKPLNNFELVGQFDRYKFVYTLDRKKLEPKTLYIDSYEKGDRGNFILLPSGEPIFTYFVTQ